MILHPRVRAPNKCTFLHKISSDSPSSSAACAPNRVARIRISSRPSHCIQTPQRLLFSHCCFSAMRLKFNARFCLSPNSCRPRRETTPLTSASGLLSSVRLNTSECPSGAFLPLAYRLPRASVTLVKRAQGVGKNFRMVRGAHGVPDANRVRVRVRKRDRRCAIAVGLSID